MRKLIAELYETNKLPMWMQRFMGMEIRVIGDAVVIEYTAFSITYYVEIV